MDTTPTPAANDWYAPLAAFASLGSQADRPGSLAGLAAARRDHLSQFFTPEPLTRFIWSLAGPAIARAAELQSPVRILDNSAGSGRLLRHADPGRHALYGVDVHHESVLALAGAAEAAGFAGEFACCPMEEIHPRNFHLALINPPFSIPLSSPSMFPYPCTTFGKYGPHTSAVSHAYAVHQALHAAFLVIAVLPTTYAESLASEPDMDRLAALISLPSGCFREEGTEVDVCLAVFDSQPRALRRLSVQSLDDQVPDLGLYCPRQDRHARLGRIGVEPTEPVITRPVTGDRTVRVTHDGRKIGMGFACGLVEAKVRNAILKRKVDPARVTEIRRPKGTVYTGQGVLDIEVHLAQHDPRLSFADFLRQIQDAGGAPTVDAGLLTYLNRRIRASARMATPFRHTVFVPSGTAGGENGITGRARQRQVADKKVWGSPIIAAGEEIQFTREASGTYQFTLKNKTFALSSDELAQRFEVTTGAATTGWQTVHPGLLLAFPEIASGLRARARRFGIDAWLTWDYQLEDALELTLKGCGVAAWKMGLGKARLSAALVLLSGCKRGLICVESQLVPEMVRELSQLPIPAEQWRVISTASDLDDLRQINVISYERLRSPIDRQGGKTTYARKMRRRIGVVVADEGHLLANADSQQSRALWNLSAKHRYVLTGTPNPNYPRDLHPLMAFAGADGTAAQPWGYQRGYLETNWRQSMNYARRGVDAFREKFIVVEWSTREFDEKNRDGAKREIPRLGNVPMYRAAIAPFVKRRITEEPDVRRYLSIPVPTKRVVDIDWDEDHLAYYLGVCEEFAQWYKKAKGGGKQLNLITLLARIQAVQFAANYPQKESQYRPRFHGLTSKQRYAVTRLAELAEEGKKVIFYADSPGLLNLVNDRLRQDHDIDGVLFHGERNIKERTRDLDERFRFGPAPILMASLGVTQAGLNIHQAEVSLFYNRSWSAKTEAQALARLLRPQQKKDVVAEFLHLPGSVDLYQAQMVEMKQDASDAGLDWATPTTDDMEFLHIDTIIGRFASDYAQGIGIHMFDLRKHLAGGAYRSMAAA